jgi:hypothetical protein
MCKSVFLRHLGLVRRLPKPVPAINFRAYRRLGRMGGCLNQLLARGNPELDGGLTREFAELLLEELQTLRRALVTSEEDDY